MSARRHYGNFTRPPSESSVDDASLTSEQPSRRPANVYDAVAGRVTQAGLIGNITDVKSSRQPLRPDEVLFKQANAPIRYEETDYYNAHASLPADQQLPSGELLTAIHAYVSTLYSRTVEGDSQPTWKCMDETALIALAILMEETAREVLGETGDFAFVEAADDEEEEVLGVRDEHEEPEEDSLEPIEVGSESTSDGSRYSSEESD
ncbi:uncharacterized protein EKO05_0008446 [Ascochyta rabiei]|uniref:Uncharacterized protein n=1 Tax=Didymella rabiei TaxID=5454 RepID=A0A163A3B0_DIDRA|nr:uncharacterized protein EKO05_0008446 [Ascochyta rabiei]KZM20957.1 hypothetical protein ST47_g7899 [Ascochyta rabiei]UPX18132.1 hypothetical protein EKO05_0008446 [Ascochyta rabiei]